MITDLQQTGFWEPQTLEPGDWRLWEAGTLRLWVKREQHEWRLTTKRRDEEIHELKVSQDEPPPEGASWRRWAFKEEDATITLAPAMPDKPLVVRPDSPVRIPRGNEVLFFVSVPVFLQLYVGAKKDLFIHEEPSVVLSKTWFGPPTAGELCYGLRTGCSRELNSIKKARQRAICPVVIANRSNEEFNFEKLSVRAMHVNVHCGASRLWTEEIGVSYRGENIFSEISFSKEPPTFEPIRVLLGPAREPAPKGSFIKKSFDSLWTL